MGGLAGSSSAAALSIVIAEDLLDQLPGWWDQDKFIARHVDSTDVEIFDSMRLAHGRNHAPAILSEWLDRYRWPGRSAEERLGYRRTFLRSAVVGAWTTAEFPASDPCWSRQRWIEVFREADFRRPATALVIYRGATSDRRLGMSWTADQERALWFAERSARWLKRNAYVYRAVLVGPEDEAVLCDVAAIEGDGGRHEAEIIVDPKLLGPIERVTKVDPTGAAAKAEASRDLEATKAVFGSLAKAKGRLK